MNMSRSWMILAGLLVTLLVVATHSEDLIPAAQAQGTPCSVSTLKGPYAFAIPGHVQGVGPIAAAGTTSFDGLGRTTIKGFINTTTSAPPTQATLTGTYTVDPQTCTGSATYTAPPPGLFGRFTQLRFEAVIVRNGEEVRYLITTPGVVFAGASVRQFAAGGPP